MSSTLVQSTEAGADEVKEKFKEIVRSNGIKDTVSEIVVSDAGLKGEGFASVTQYVTVKFENPDIKPLNLFVKVHTSNASHTEMLEELKAFEKETTFLLHYVAAAKEMCRAKGREGFIDFYPKCYFGDEHTVVLENLVLDKHYELLNKEARQDFEAATFALKTLAKHHAISHVMIEESGGPEPFFKRFPKLDYEVYDKPIMLNLMGQSYDSSLNSNLKILERSNVKDVGSITERLKKHMNRVHEKVLHALKPQNDDIIKVLGHGDYWNNNMMFLRDKETKKLKHHVAIDFQITRYNSPALDLGYYMYTSVQPEVRKKHRKELLEIYLDTLNKTSDEFGHPMNISYEQLLREFRKKFVFGFWVGFTIAIGPGMTLFQQVDISEIDIKNWIVVFDSLINKWIDANPEKVDELTYEISKVLDEYEELLLDDPNLYVPADKL